MPEESGESIDLLLSRIWEHVTLPEGTDLTSRVSSRVRIRGLASTVPFTGMAIRSQRGRIAF